MKRLWLSAALVMPFALSAVQSVTITVPRSSLADGVTLTDIPLLVRVSEATVPGFTYAAAGENRVSFANADENPLAFDIDTWNTSGESLVWVRVPSLTRGTAITMSWDLAAAPANDPTAVWSAKYAGVWHCNDASGALTDATGHGLSAAPTGSVGYTENMTSFADGAIGRARQNLRIAPYFAGGRATHFVEDAPALRVGSVFTYSGWYKSKEIVGTTFLASTKTTYAGQGWGLHFSNAAAAEFPTGRYRGDGEAAVPFDVPFANGVWNQFTLTVDGTALNVYTNGALAASLQVNAATQTGFGLGIGGCPFDENGGAEIGWTGWFDEIRYHAGAANADEIAAIYKMETDPAFLDYGEPSDVDSAAFAKSLTLTLNPEYADSAVTDAQVLVRLSSGLGDFSYSDFQDAGGADLAFATADGKLVPHEIDMWNTSGESLVWVRLPSGAPDTRLFVYYGSETYRSSGAAKVWKDYTGVWHMNETGVAETAVDATEHGLDAEPMGAYAAENNKGISDGVIGYARKNGGNSVIGNKSYLSVPNYDAYGLGSRFAASGFFRVTGGEGWYRFFSRRGGAGGGWGQELYIYNNELICVYGAEGSTSVAVPNLKNSWVHLTFVYDGRTCFVYANGAPCGVLDINAATDNGQPLSFGCTSDGGDWPLDGDYDELRLTGRIPSAAEVAFGHAGMTADDFWLADPPVPPVVPAPEPPTRMQFRRSVDFTVPAAFLGDEVLTNFPVLVRLSSAIPGFTYDDFRATDDSDFVFADRKFERIYAHQVDEWHPDGESLIWVFLPELKAGTVFRMYYGSDASVAGAEPVAAAWDGFAGAWHFNEGATLAGVTQTWMLPARDASGNGLDAVPQADSSPTGSANIRNCTDYAAGVIGHGRQNQPSWNYYSGYNSYRTPRYESLRIGEQFSFSGWFQANQAEKDGVGPQRLVSRKTSYEEINGWEVELTSQKTSRLTARGGDAGGVSGDIPDLVSGWVHLAFTFEKKAGLDATLRIYANGDLVASGNAAPAQDNGYPLAFGGNANNTEKTFNGEFDEFRLRRGTASDNWIKAEYLTASSLTFLEAGAVRSLTGLLVIVF